MGAKARLHIGYAAVILVLLGLLVVQNIPRMSETRAQVPGRSGGENYELRMLGSGDLVFQRNDFLPLASSRDYWGDMTVAHAEWLGESSVVVSMSDGTRLTVHLGSIDVALPADSP